MAELYIGSGWVREDTWKLGKHLYELTKGDRHEGFKRAWEYSSRELAEVLYPELYAAGWNGPLFERTFLACCNLIGLRYQGPDDEWHYPFACVQVPISPHSNDKWMLMFEYKYQFSFERDIEQCKALTMKMLRDCKISAINEARELCKRHMNN